MVTWGDQQHVSNLEVKRRLFSFVEIKTEVRSNLFVNEIRLKVYIQFVSHVELDLSEGQNSKTRLEPPGLSTKGQP